MDIFIICIYVWIISGVITSIINMYEAIHWRKQVDINDICMCVLLTLMGTFGLFMTIKDYCNIDLDTIIWKAKE